MERIFFVKGKSLFYLFSQCEYGTGPFWREEHVDRSFKRNLKLPGVGCFHIKTYHTLK